MLPGQTEKLNKELVFDFCRLFLIAHTNTFSVKFLTEYKLPLQLWPEAMSPLLTGLCVNDAI